MITILRSAWTIARKDLVLFVRDRTALLLAFALPILLTSIFGAAMGGMMGGGGGPAKKIQFWVEDLDGTPRSRAFVDKLLASNGLRVEEVADVRARVRNGDVAAALVVPAGYAAELAEGKIPRVQLLRDPGQMIAQQVIAGNLMPVLFEAVLMNVGSSVMGTGLEKLGFPAIGMEDARTIMSKTWDDMGQLVSELTAQGAFDEGESAGPVEDPGPQDGPVVTSDGFNFLEDVPALLGVEAEDVTGEKTDDGLPRSGGASHATAAMAVMMLMFSLVAAGGSLLEEQEGGTLLRLQLAPSAGASILIGKLIMLSVTGLLQLLLLFVYGSIVFDVPLMGHLPGLVLTSLGLVVAATGLGLLFATACTSRKQMEGLSTLVILIMSCVGGAWFPREVTPDWFQTAGRFTITAWAMDAYHGVLWFGKGLFATGGLSGVWREVAMLFAIGIVLNYLAFYFYAKRFGRVR